MIGRRQKVWGVLLLLALLLAVVSCDRTSTTPTGDNGNVNPPADVNVFGVSMWGDKPLVRNYLGKTDTLTLTAKAFDEGHVGVAAAHVTFSIVNGPGSIARQDTATDASGDIKATYVVTLTSEDPMQVTISAMVNGKEDTKTFEIVSQEVSLNMFSNPKTFSVPYGEEGKTDVTLSVSDTTGIGIAGIPVRLEKIGALIWNDVDGVFEVDNENRVSILLSPISFTGTDGTVKSTLSMNPVTEKVQVILKSTITLPPVEKGIAKKGKDSLRSRVRGLINSDKSSSIAGGGNHGIASSDTVVYDTVTISPFEEEIAGVFVTVEPELLVVPRNSSGQAIVSAVAYDKEHNAIPGLVFNFTLTNEDDPDQPAGVLSAQTAVTDSIEGKATTTIFTNRQFGRWKITANATSNPENEKTAYINVEESASVSYSIDMNVTPDEIFADNGITRSNVMIRLRDQDDIAVTNDTVFFAARGGYLPGAAITDSTGSINLIFSDIGDTAMYEPARITAIYRKSGVTLAEETAFVTINPVPAPSLLNFVAQRENVVVSPTDSIRCDCQVRTADAQMVTPGTPVYFAIDENQGIFDPAIAFTDGNSNATTYYRYGITANPSVDIYAYTAFEDFIYESNRVSITIRPAGPAYIAGLQSSVNIVDPEDEEPVLIACAVVDTFFNTVGEGVGVQFTTDKGNIEPSVTTNEFGIAVAEFAPGTQAGIAKIKASVNATISDSIYLNILANNAFSIELTSNLEELQVFGTGGVETAVINAAVVDASGNPVEQTDVHFLLVESPRDTTGLGQRVNCTMGGSDGTNTTDPDAPFYTPYTHNFYGYGLPYVIIPTNSGIAQVAVTSGTAKGPIRVIAWIITDEDEQTTSEASFEGLQVVAGPPDHIELDVNYEGTDLGGAAWSLEVSARVQDARGNDVSHGYAVVFGTDDPEVHIGEGITGNANAAGDTVDGVAFTTLTYHSVKTNQEVTIFASVLTPNGPPATDDFTFALPIQEPRGLLYVDVLNWNFGVHGPENPAVFDVEVLVLDGHNHWINDQLVRFMTNKGRYYRNPGMGGNWPDNNLATDELTGQATRDAGLSTDGWADLYLVITLVEGFPEPVPETTAQASAEIVGYADATVEPIVLNLYQ